MLNDLTHSDVDLLEFAYRAQCRCNPAASPAYLQNLIDIKTCLSYSASHLDLALESLIAVEYSRDRWNQFQIETAAELLGFGKDRVLRLEWNEIDDDFLISAWKDSMRRAWDNPSSSRQRRFDLTRSARILAEQRGSRKVMEILRSSNPEMDPEQAFRLLEVPKDVEEGMLLMVYQMRVSSTFNFIFQLKRSTKGGGTAPAIRSDEAGVGNYCRIQE